MQELNPENSRFTHSAKGDSVVEYAGFWRRLGAHLIDTVFVLPISAFSIWMSSQFRLYQLYHLIPGMLFALWYSVYLVKRYGGTPGKLLVKTRIQMLDGKLVDMRAAFLRFSVIFLLTTLLSVGYCIAVLQMTDLEYLSLSFLERAKAITTYAPFWFEYVNWALQAWVWGEFIVILFNKRRRAPHDFIAGTVVIKTT